MNVTRAKEARRGESMIVAHYAEPYLCARPWVRIQGLRYRSSHIEYHLVYLLRDCTGEEHTCTVDRENRSPLTFRVGGEQAPTLQHVCRLEPVCKCKPHIVNWTQESKIKPKAFFIVLLMQQAREDILIPEIIVWTLVHVQLCCPEMKTTKLFLPRVFFKNTQDVAGLD